MNPHVIYGPPGTGKTTRLLGLVDEAIQGGLPPDKICYVGFTRRSANEARERACEKFKLDAAQLPWFRTLHSLAFGMLMLNKSQVMQVGDYLALCKQLGLSITLSGGINEDGTFAGQTKGDRLLFAEAMARSRMQDLKAYWETIPDEDIYWYELLQLSESLDAYKQQHDKMDFTDVIFTYAHGNHPTPPVDILIVDEAQDLSPLQWRMVEKLAKDVPKTYIAGDDDQAIFRWAGADVEHLIKMPGTKEVLGQSYRVPEKIQQVANEVAERIHVRVKKDWKSREAVGLVEHLPNLESVDMSSGTWLLLARNSFLLEIYQRHCLQEGFLFESKASEYISLKNVPAIMAWEDLRAGKKLPAWKIKPIYELMASGTGIARGYKGKFDEVPDKAEFTLDELRLKQGLVKRASDSWDVALERITDIEREYFLSALRRGEKFTDKPRIRISTIHGAKGAEADNVVIQLDMAERTFNEFEKFPDDEHRVWYVAVTRARERLIVLAPRTDRCYNL